MSTAYVPIPYCEPNPDPTPIAGSTPPVDPTSLLLEQRGRSHGDYSSMARLSQDIKGRLRAEPEFSALPPEVQEALDLISLKMVRIVKGDPDFLEHWDDIKGYAELGRTRRAW